MFHTQLDNWPLVLWQGIALRDVYNVTMVSCGLMVTPTTSFLVPLVLNQHFTLGIQPIFKPLAAYLTEV